MRAPARLLLAACLAAGGFPLTADPAFLTLATSLLDEGRTAEARTLSHRGLS